MAAAAQTFANHRRFDPWFHYFEFPLAVVVLVWSLVRLFRGQGGIVELLMAILLLLAIHRLRVYALRVQDRLIRLEETLRMQALLPEDLRARIHELRPGQFVALRFASDGELAERVREALSEGLRSPEIKQRIKSLRADQFRV